MAQLLSQSHIECIINGHRFTNWANEDPPYDFEEEDAIETETGSDGGLYVHGMPKFGAIFVFKMFPSSPTTQWAIQQEQLRKNAYKNRTAVKVYEGTLTNSVQGVSFSMAGGYILNFPATLVPNKTYEGRIQFEEIISNVDGGVFHPPLTSNPAG